MRRSVRIVSLGFLLLIIEYIICLLLFSIESFFKHDSQLNLEHAIRGANEVNSLRLIFYYPLWCFFMYYIYDKIRFKNVLIKLALINTGLYILLSFIFTLIFSLGSVFVFSFFYDLVVATFVSPFILYTIPNMKNWYAQI
jgi:hypothetical protein